MVVEEGRGVAKDEGEAVAWYRRAAQQGLTDAHLDQESPLVLACLGPSSRCSIAYKHSSKSRIGIHSLILALS